MSSGIWHSDDGRGGKKRQIFSSTSHYSLKNKMLGGKTSSRPVDQGVRDLFAKVANSFVSAVGLGSPSEVTLISYKTQIVAGVNYFVVVKAANGKHYELRIFKGLDDSVSLAGHKEVNATEGDL